MWRAFINTLKVKELRNRLLFTALIIVLVRVASNIPCPGINPAALERFIKDAPQRLKKRDLGMRDLGMV